ncbi:MAG TPA: gliding motility lipoprotein GldH [Sphingobacteriaceae bacterium]|nr:gliding motility lipoprotein GldH [Sphingobacteriaceae bacterium]
MKNPANRMNAVMRVFLIAILSLSFGLSSCIRNDALVDTHQAIAGHHWSYLNKVQIPFQIEDTTPGYNILINLRHTADYKYSNIFFLVHILSPDGKRSTERKEFRLALPDGEWLGKGSGNIYSYQLPYKAGYRFNKKGRYVVILEQNMRNNPLREVTDAGLRLELAK